MPVPETTPPLERRRRRLAISVRVMMVLVLLVGLPMGWKARRASLQRRAIAAVERAGGSVHFDDEVATPPWPPGPAWLRRAIGDEYFREVTSVKFDFDVDKGKDIDSAAADAIMERIADFDHLIELDFFHGRITSAGFGHLARLRHLEWLQVEGVDAGDDDLGFLRGLSHLKCLSIDIQPDGKNKNRMTKASLAYLGGMTGLESLAIKGITLDRPDDLAPLAGMTALSILILDQSPRDEACLSYLRGLKQINHLELKNTRLSDAGMRALTGIDSLEKLRIDGGNLTDDGLAELARYPYLETLEISDLGRATDEGVAALLWSKPDDPREQIYRLSLPRAGISGRFLANVPAPRFPNLIDLSDSAVTDAGLANLPANAVIPKLTLAGTKITATGLSHLAALKMIIELDLSRTSIDGAGLARTAEIPGLSVLNLSQTSISDADLPMLYPARRLIMLDLTGTKVTPEGIKALRERMDLTVGPIRRDEP